MIAMWAAHGVREVLPMRWRLKHPSRSALRARPVQWLGALLTSAGVHAVLGALTA